MNAVLIDKIAHVIRKNAFGPACGYTHRMAGRPNQDLCGRMNPQPGVWALVRFFAVAIKFESIDDGVWQFVIFRAHSFGFRIGVVMSQ